MTTNVAVTGNLRTFAEATVGEFVYLSDIESIHHIFDNIEIDIDFTSDKDKDGIPDYYEEKIIEGVLRLGDGTTIDGLQMGNPDTDGDGLKDGEELVISVIESSVIHDNQQIVYVRMHSNPTMIDTDGDGYIDSEDDRPTMWDVSDRDLAILAQASYANFGNGNSFDDYNTPNWWFINNEVASLEEMQGWTQVDFNIDSDNGFGCALYQKNDNLVFSFRGTDGETLDILEDIALFFGIDTQYRSGIKYLEERNFGIDLSNKNIYFTGHSLGGYLALRVAANFLDDSDCDFEIKKINTFNSPGINTKDIIWHPGFLLHKSIIKLKHLDTLKQNDDLIFNYHINGNDWLALVPKFGYKPGESEGYEIGELTQKYVFEEEVDFFNNNKSHPISNFLEQEEFGLNNYSMS